MIISNAILTATFITALVAFLLLCLLLLAGNKRRKKRKKKCSYLGFHHLALFL
jgi:hypothetical protein